MGVSFAQFCYEIYEFIMGNCIILSSLYFDRSSHQMRKLQDRRFTAFPPNFFGPIAD